MCVEKNLCIFSWKYPPLRFISVTVLLFIRVLLCTQMITVQQMIQRKSCARVSLENSCLSLGKTNTCCYHLEIKNIYKYGFAFSIGWKRKNPSLRQITKTNVFRKQSSCSGTCFSTWLYSLWINFFLRSIHCSQRFCSFHYLSHQYQRITTRTGGGEDERYPN